MCPFVLPEENAGAEYRYRVDVLEFELTQGGMIIPVLALTILYYGIHLYLLVRMLPSVSKFLTSFDINSLTILPTSFAA